LDKTPDDEPAGAAGVERRFSARRKVAAVARLLRGEPLETIARDSTSPPRG
jgi:hypothetical protein